MDWLRYGAEHYPNRICINEYTYNDIYRGVVHVARTLEPLKVSRVAILLDYPHKRDSVGRFTYWQLCSCIKRYYC